MAGSYEIGKLVWQITGDASGINKSLSDTEKSAKKTAGVLSGVASSIKSAFAIGAVVMFGKSLAKASSDAQETAQKFGVVFSSIQGDAQKAAKSLQAEFNFSTTAAMDMLAGTGNLLQGLGYTQEAALKMSESIAQLGSDLTSMNNYAGGAAEASRILTKALLGEREALQALDIKVTDDQLRAYAKSLGTTWDALTQAEKAQATYNVILAQTGNAIGDVERSSASAAYTWRKLENIWEDVKVTLGDELLPGLTALGQTLITTAGDSGPLLDAFKLIVSMSGKTVQNIAMLINILGSFKNAVKVYTSAADAEAAAEERHNYQLRLRAKFESEMRARQMSLMDLLKAKAAEGNRDAAAELAYLKKLDQAAADTADQSRESMQTYINGVAKIDRAEQESSRSIQQSVSERTKARKREQEDQRTQFLKSQSLMSSGGGNNSAEKARLKEIDEIRRETAQQNVEYEETATERIDREIKEREALYDKYGLNRKEDIDDLYQWEKNKLKEREKAEWESLSNSINNFNSYAQQIGGALSGMLSAFQAYADARYQADITKLEAQLEAELEAAGVSEETTVEQAQREYDIAVATGTALEIEDKRKALVKAQIEEKYQKKKAELEYKAAMTSWDFQMAIAAMQIPLATMNAIASGAQAPWFMQPWFMIAMGTMAGTAAAAQFGAVAESKPQKAAYFYDGGIIPGSQQGTAIIAGEKNQTEVVMNQNQMANTLMAIANGGASNQRYMQVPAMSESSLWDLIFKASKNGDLLIAERAVTTR